MPRSSVAQQRPVSTGALTSSTVSQIQCRNSVDSGMNVHVHTCIDRQTFIHSFFHRPLRGCTNSFRPAFLKQPLVTHPIHTVHRPKLKGKPGSKRRRQGKNFEKSSGSEAKEIPTRGNRRGRRSRASVDRRLHRLNELRAQRRRDYRAWISSLRGPQGSCGPPAAEISGPSPPQFPLGLPNAHTSTPTPTSSPSPPSPQLPRRILLKQLFRRPPRDPQSTSHSQWAYSMGAHSSTTPIDHTHSRTCRPARSQKQHTNIAYWNVRGILEAAKLHSLVMIAERFGIELLCITETHAKSTDFFRIRGWHVFHSGAQVRKGQTTGSKLSQGLAFWCIQNSGLS